jgi:hypothetical protein
MTKNNIYLSLIDLTTMSVVWKYYNNVPVSKNVICTICFTELVRSNASTSTMWTHLKGKHKEEFNLIQHAIDITGETSKVIY